MKPRNRVPRWKACSMLAGVAAMACACTLATSAPRSLDMRSDQALETARMIVEAPGLDASATSAIRHAHYPHQGPLGRGRSRPAWYWWQQGSAVSAGVATGYVNGSRAVAWAGPAPVPNYCWYFTEKGSLHGFWDVCP